MPRIIENQHRCYSVICLTTLEKKRMTFDDYAMIMKNNNQTEGFVINPFSSNLIFKRDYVKQLFDKKVEILTKE